MLLLLISLLVCNDGDGDADDCDDAVHDEDGGETLLTNSSGSF
jgi:hypothetical protein